MDGNDGSRRSTKVVAKNTVQGQHHSPTWVKERDDILSKKIFTHTSRELNYVHHGWSPAAVATFTPWTASRINWHQQVNESGYWVTKRTLVQRLTLNIPPEDITSVPEFDADVWAALGRPTASEKLKALEKVFELGALLAISDTDPNFTQGGDPSVTPDNIVAWLSRGVHPFGWAQARII
ncbi:hypothetical protein FRC07_001427 [Ceratobasidium sp. 392]|nr:hypothetical protein FRC07_001427 [Ceratobasidium sp. 392]